MHGNLNVYASSQSDNVKEFASTPCADLEGLGVRTPPALKISNLFTENRPQNPPPPSRQTQLSLRPHPPRKKNLDPRMYTYNYPYTNPH